MKNDKKKLNTGKLKAALKEFVRKLIVSLKKNPSVIPFAMLIISFLVFSLNLTAISNTTAKIQGIGMGLCEFCSMLFSILSMICLLNAFPKRQKPNLAMIFILFAFCGLIITTDIVYIMRINASAVKITKATAYITTAKKVMTSHIVCTALTAVTIALEPVFAKLLKKINTSVAIEETSVGEIELSDEE